MWTVSLSLCNGHAQFQSRGAYFVNKRDCNLTNFSAHPIGYLERVLNMLTCALFHGPVHP